MDNSTRRQLLKFLAASPLLYCTAAGRLLADESLDAIELPDYLIQSPADALDVFDFHAVAKHNLPPATTVTWRPAPMATKPCRPTGARSTRSTCGRGA